MDNTKATQMKNKFHIAILVFLFLGYNSTLFSQEKKRNFECMIRAKALGFVIIEDRWVRSFSAGTELRFFDQFSIVLDYVHFRFRNETEVYTTPDYSEYVEYSEFDARNYLATELRYYPRFFSSFNYRPYVNVSSKFGKRNLYLEDNYPLEEGTVLKLNSQFYDLGASLGMEIGKRFGFDFNLGYAHRFETKSEDIYHEDGTKTFTKNVPDNRWIPNVRVQFYWNLGEKKNT
jgi:hypothetical protein